MGGWGAILDGSEVLLVSFAGSGYGYLQVGYDGPKVIRRRGLSGC